VRLWWSRVGRSFLEALWRRLTIGCVFGSLAGIGVHLITRDSHFQSFFQRNWATLTISDRFDGFSTYQTELVVLAIAVGSEKSGIPHSGNSGTPSDSRKS
jgi:hypothetical protein